MPVISALKVMKAFLPAVAICFAFLSSGAQCQTNHPVTQEEAHAIAAKAMGTKCNAPFECKFLSTRVESGWHVIVRFCRRSNDGKCYYGLGGAGHRPLRVNDDKTVDFEVAA
jgi:hypothetical protein